MRILGINALNHDAAVCVIEDGEILFGAHSERYSGKKKWQARYTNLVDKRHVFGRHVYNKNVELLHKEVLISKKNERIFDKIFNFVNAYYFYIKIRFKSILIACKFN